MASTPPTYQRWYLPCPPVKDSAAHPPVKDGAHPSTVSTVPVYMQASGKEDPVFYSYGAVGEGGNKQLVPACGEKTYGHSAVSMTPITVLCPHLWKQHVPDPSLSTPKSRLPKWDPSKCYLEKGSQAPMYEQCFFLLASTRAMCQPREVLHQAHPLTISGHGSFFLHMRRACALEDLGELPKTSPGDGTVSLGHVECHKS